MRTDPLSQEFYDARKAELSGRVSKKRFAHIEGVAGTAVNLAEVYGESVGKARLAGLLHDWDKGMNDDEIRKRVRMLGIEDEVGPWVVQNMPQVLHGPTAATALAREFPEIPPDVTQAIYRHTTAAKDMSDLDKIIYVADAIEPGRKFDRLPDLQSHVGRVSLDDLFYEVYKFWTMALVEHDVVLHPDTIGIWNEISAPRMERRKAERREKGRRGQSPSSEERRKMGKKEGKHGRNA